MLFGVAYVTELIQPNLAFPYRSTDRQTQKFVKSLFVHFHVATVIHLVIQLCAELYLELIQFETWSVLVLKFFLTNIKFNERTRLIDSFRRFLVALKRTDWINSFISYFTFNISVRENDSSPNWSKCWFIKWTASLSLVRVSITSCGVAWFETWNLNVPSSW